MNCDASIMSSVNVPTIMEKINSSNISAFSEVQKSGEKNGKKNDEKPKKARKIRLIVNESSKKVEKNMDQKTNKKVDEVIDQINNDVKKMIESAPITENTDISNILSHLEEYIEEPYTLIESYFRGKHLERLVRHQIESYNHFINYQVQKTIQMFNPVIVHSENDYIPEKEKYFLEIEISFENFKLYPPQIHENNGATKIMLPHEAKLRNFTYASNMTIDLQVQYIVRDTENMETPKIIKKHLPKINIGKMPIMLKSSICILNQNKHIDDKLTGECHFDCGGYFIIKGSEKTVLGQERAAENRIYCFDGKNTTKWNWFAEIKSVPDFKCISPKQIDMMIASKNNGFGNGLYVSIPRIKQPIELFVLFRALGILSDKDICNHILLDISQEKQSTLLNCLQASIIDANKYLTQESAIQHIVSMVAYTPINMDRETGLRKKREFTMEVLNNDLFPHCSTITQKKYLLGYMAKKLLETSLGWIAPDDRDSYLNKRIELTGTLLNNLFRNYFNKLVKEMQKQIVREINSRSWRTTEDYENILNMTNIYKIMKSTTIENGITRSLSTGDFSIKQSNSSKVGVAQVLSRLTYLSSLSHLRRINTPLEKSGELIAPRKLHNTTWGFLCLSGDTEVLLSNRIKTKKIKDIKDGDWVNTVNRETLLDEPSEIFNKFCKMPDNLFEITTIGGRTIKATSDHPFLTKIKEGKYEMKKVNELNDGDELIVHHTAKFNLYEKNKCNNGCISVPILSIKEIEPELVYDFTTRSDNHSFVASYFVCSNCPAESPEGQSIGIVKNISYMTHITIPTNSSSLYEYVRPYIHSVDDTPCEQLFNKVKVFVNGAWLGISENPIELYENLKEKKHQGIINIYTSIIFDFKMMEIRVCNDGGRLTRPVLRVKNNKAIITRDIIERIEKKELGWNDLLTNCIIPESVIEYIDPDEQNQAMIAMGPKQNESPNQTYNYTHCEIHPSTIFGVLASCVPFPDHNQAPRNTYQCISPDEFVWMADGSKKAIKDISIGEKVLSFNPNSLNISETSVVNHFVRPNEHPIYKLQTISGREIIATEDHKFMTNKGWKTVGEMKENISEYKIGIYSDSEDIELFKTAEQLKSKNIGIIEEKNNCLFINISSISQEPDGLISDIEVASDNHSFIAGSNFLSSNCAMSKQAIGVYATNYDKRMDKTAYVLTYPSRPLVDTRLMNFIHLNCIPSGAQIHVAIMTHTGYNQEDSVLINKGSIDRGLFTATIYHTEKDEDKNIIRDEIIRCKPDKTKTKGIKFGNYEKLNQHGFIPENSLVENRDVIIAKIIPIKENRNDPTKTIKYEDQSKTFRTTEETYIDQNYTGRNGDGYNFAKVRVRTFRKPVLGDKFACSLPTQQVLTDHGWIQMIDIDIEKHKVATLDTNGNMCYEHPINKFEYDHDGEMYFIENKQVHMICTLNHKMYVQRRYGKQYELIEAQDMMGKMVRFQKSMTNAYPDVENIVLGEVPYKMDDWLLLLGMFIGDGSSNKRGSIRLSAFKERKVEYNTQLLEKLGIPVKYNTDYGNFSINQGEYPEIYEELDKYSVGALNKYLPDYVWSLSQRQCIILMEALMQSDGHNMSSPLGKTEFSRYCTISLRLANDISRLATHCGWSGIIKIKAEPDGIAREVTATKGTRKGKTSTITLKHTYYSIAIIKSQNQPWINKKKNESNTETLINYSGKVYCIEMPSSNLYYFRENNFTASMLSGNSRAGQKGTAGNIIPECDMPFTKDGLRPDLILNPHAIPSRMTIAHLKETLLGKVLIELGLFGDGTSFGDLSVKKICEELQKLGYESYGNEVMYNGLTGEQLETNIFFGPTYYQRLKHMVNDKQHSRSIGPMVNLTRQPQEGRSKDGGFRIGEMERDVMLGHGMSKFCRERLYDSSDKYSIYVCKKCGMVPSYNDGAKNSLYNKNSDFTIHLCNTCNNTTDFAKVEVPYAYKLLSQELQTINIMPRIITE